MFNYQAEISQVVSDLNSFYKGLIKEMGLVKTGGLLNSIAWRYKKSNQGFHFEMIAKDYFESLNKKYKIQDLAETKPKFKQIMKRVAKIEAQQKVQEFINEVKQIK